MPAAMVAWQSSNAAVMTNGKHSGNAETIGALASLM